MSIRMGNSCVNCDNLMGDDTCKVHVVKISTSYTCDSFEMKAALKDDPNCVSCARYEGPSCSNPQKAALGMLRAQWAPQNAQA
ncbi:hypothetical protein [Nonlabens sp.]|jgi:hypothetical protein|uniref:hypothetical protein n=1 Tax=Nonlabens sp. TaxID=1888209 RepID=UPI0039E436D6